MSCRRATALALISAALFMAAGCGGGPILEAEGNVTFDGKPLESGSISFEPIGGKGRDFGGIIENGTYKVKSLPGGMPGPALVRIRAVRTTGKKIPAGSPSPPGTMVDEVIQIAKRYNDDSNMKVELEAGKVNKLDFQLQR